MTYAVIMAGGVGSRFWPASTRKYPKQFLSLFSDKSLLQETVQRIKPLIPADRIYVITNQQYVSLVKKQVPEIPEAQIIGEPVAKNTAPCVAAAARLIAEKKPGAIMAVLPADHYIRQPQHFCGTLDTAIQKAKEGENLVTIGIEPTRPETGYGYIHYDNKQSTVVKNRDVYKVKAFTEKPDRDTAKKFLQTGEYVWNSGMFIWKADSVLQEIEKQLPDMAALSESITAKEPETLHNFYLKCKAISIDYGIMEHAKNVYVVPDEFGWNDVGSWKAVHELVDKDEHGNVKLAENIYIADSNNNMIFSKTDKIVVMAGLENVGYIETEDAILLVNLNEAQKVKKVVSALKSKPETKRYT